MDNKGVSSKTTCVCHFWLMYACLRNKYQYCTSSFTFYCSGWSKGGGCKGHARLHLWTKNFFIFMQFLGKNWSNNRLVPPLWGWRTPLWEILDPPLYCISVDAQNPSLSIRAAPISQYYFCVPFKIISSPIIPAATGVLTFNGAASTSDFIKLILSIKNCILVIWPKFPFQVFIWD